MAVMNESLAQNRIPLLATSPVNTFIPCSKLGEPDETNLGCSLENLLGSISAKGSEQFGIALIKQRL